MEQKILNYIEGSCGTGKYFSSRIQLLNQLRKTRRPNWAGIPVKEFIAALTQLLKNDGIKVEEAS